MHNPDPTTGTLLITPRFMASHIRVPSSYPHQYKNYEKFKFKCHGHNYYEFPILEDRSYYHGSKPGPDRVVYEYVIPVSCRDGLSVHPFSLSDYGEFCGCITHTGASGNGFKKCKSE